MEGLTPMQNRTFAHDCGYGYGIRNFDPHHQPFEVDDYGSQ